MVAQTFPPYTFEEFHEHASRATKLLAEYREAGEGSFERSVIKTMEMFDALYLDPVERQFKHGRFCLIMSYMSEHLQDFDRGDFAVYGSERVGSLVGEHLLRAVHHFYTSNELFDQDSKPPTPDVIMVLAEQFRDAEEQPA